MLEEIFFLDFWSYNFFGNTIKDYVMAFFILSASLIAFKVFQNLILFRLKKIAQKTKTDIDDTVVKIFQSIKLPFYIFFSFYLALSYLIINEFVQKIIDAILIILVVYHFVKAFQILVDYLVERKISERSSKETLALIARVLKGVFWTFGALLLLSNFGVNITSLIAGMGIGGVAVALALQNILGDLFSSFAIHFDKPFVIGDFIVIDDDLGVVEKIGIKTTRLRSLQGEEIVISNQELTSARIHNYKKMQARRVVFSFGVTYGTPLKKLEKIPKIIENIISKIKLIRFDRAHFYKYGDSALLFEVVYYVKTGDYNQYMDINQEIHLRIKEQFEKENISMAFPSQTIYLSSTKS